MKIPKPEIVTKNTNRVVVPIFLMLFVGEYLIMHYYHAKPFHYETLVKYAIAYPIYQLYFAFGNVLQRFANVLERISKFESDNEEKITRMESRMTHDIDKVDRRFEKLWKHIGKQDLIIENQSRAIKDIQKNTNHAE